MSGKHLATKHRLRILLGASGLLAAIALLAGSAQAASPSRFAALDRASAAACLKVANLRDARVAETARFSDRFGIEARVVMGTWPQPHMKGVDATMLCLYDRRTWRAEVQELAGGLAPQPAAQAAPLKDRQWQVLALDGRPPVPGGTAKMTLMFGSDGHIAANGGCNGFGGRYMLTGEGLKIYGPMIGTQMACDPPVMAQERRFQAFLGAVQSLAPRAGGTLLLTASDGKSTAILGPSEAARPGEPMGFETYRCGGRLIAANFSPERAIVELGGRRLDLPNRTSGDPEAPRRFSNGRVTLFQTVEGPNRGVSLAVGRAAALRCELLTGA